jgi:uncharacterized MAPEG superfamily protein
MTFAYWCVLIAAFLPLVWVGAAKSGAQGYDNDRPRPFLAGLEGWPQRANWAQANALEAFPPFAAGVIIAHLTGAQQNTIDILAGIFILARSLHGVAYIVDKGAIRSLIWLVGFGCTVGLFLIAP